MKVDSKANIRALGAAALLLCLFLVAYWGPLKSLVDVWFTDEDYSYGFLIPIVTAYLTWERRKELAETPVSTNWIGGALFFLFLLIGAYGVLGSSPSAVRPSIPFLLLFLVLFCFGGQILRKVLFPLAFLLFMIPLPTVVQTAVGVPLKVISTKLGGLILSVAGVSAFVQGNVIDLGVTQLQVVDACSGLRYILPLLALGVVFSYFFEKVRWKQVALTLLTIPIAILTNGIRIGATGILAQHYGPSVAEGFFHGFSGWIVFMFAFFLLFVVHFVLRKIGKRVDSPSVGEVLETDAIESARPWSIMPAVVACCGLLLLAGVGFSTNSLPRIALKGGFQGFPLTIGESTGVIATVDSEIVRLSGAEDVISANYREQNGATVSLYVGYRGSPFLEGANFFHSPNVCLPSSGWKTVGLTDHTVRGIPNATPISVTKMVIEQAGLKQLVYYWFQTKSRSSRDVNLNRFHLTLHALLRDNTHDLFIRPITPIAPNETVQQAEARMDGFIRDMMPVLLNFLKERQYEEKR